MSSNQAILSHDTNNKRTSKRKSRVVIPDVTTSPRTLKIMEENDKILRKYARRASRLFRK